MCIRDRVYDEILDRIVSNTGQLSFLDVPGGTSKTFFINLLLAEVKSDSYQHCFLRYRCCLAWWRQDAHSAFKLPLNLNISESALCNISKQSDLAQYFEQPSWLCGPTREVWRLSTGHYRTSGGGTVRGDDADEVKAWLKSSFLWPAVKVLSLRVSMRVHIKGDLKAEEFSALILKIGDLPVEFLPSTQPTRSTTSCSLPQGWCSRNAFAQP